MSWIVLFSLLDLVLTTEIFKIRADISGCFLQVGTYAELIESQGRFAEFLETYAGENSCYENNSSRLWCFNVCIALFADGLTTQPLHNFQLVAWNKIDYVRHIKLCSFAIMVQDQSQ